MYKVIVCWAPDLHWISWLVTDRAGLDLAHGPWNLQELGGIDALKPETFDSLLSGARAVVKLVFRLIAEDFLIISWPNSLQLWK